MNSDRFDEFMDFYDFAPLFRQLEEFTAPFQELGGPKEDSEGVSRDEVSHYILKRARVLDTQELQLPNNKV